MAGFIGNGPNARTLAPKVRPNTQPVQAPVQTGAAPAPSYTAQPWNNALLNTLGSQIGNQQLVDTAQGMIGNTNARKQLYLLNLGTKQQTGAINTNAGFGRENLQLNNNANTQQQDYLKQLQGFSNTGYNNALADLMKNYGFQGQANALANQGFGLAQGAIDTSRGFADQSNQIQQGYLNNAEKSQGLQEQDLAAQRDITQRNEPIQEAQQAGAEAASGSINGGGYGQRLGQIRQNLTDQMAAYGRQGEQLGINRENLSGARQQQDLGYRQQLSGLDQAQSQLGLSRQGQTLTEAQQRAANDAAQRDIALGRTQANAGFSQQTQNLNRASKALNIDSRQLEAGVTQALDQLGLSNQIGTAAIYQGLADQATNGFSQLSPILNMIQQIMGWSSTQPYPNPDPGRPFVGPGLDTTPPNPQLASGGTLMDFLGRISGVESGNPTAVNKDSGAWGKYQIMPSNWASWAKEAGLNPADKSAANQDKVAAMKLDQYRKQFGDAGAAVAWYAGPATAKKYIEDPTNPRWQKPQGGGKYPSIADYANKVLGR